MHLLPDVSDSLKPFSDNSSHNPTHSRISEVVQSSKLARIASDEGVRSVASVSSNVWGRGCGKLEAAVLVGSSKTGRERRGCVGAEAVATRKEKDAGRFYFNITGFPFPLGPFFGRRTIRKEVRKDKLFVTEKYCARVLEVMACVLGNVVTKEGFFGHRVFSFSEV